LRAAISIGIRILILFRQHQAAPAIAFEAEYYEGLGQRTGESFLPYLDFSFPTVKAGFLTLG